MSRRPAATPLREFSRSLPMALLRARESVMARFRPLLREHGVSEQQWRVLRALVSDGPMRASDLSADTLISMPSLSRLLKTLEAKRLIERSAHKDDQRAAQITMTRQGRRLVEAIGPLSEAIYAQIAEQVSEPHLEQLYGLLEEMSSRLGVATPEE
ncbi:MAG TPA: homoprotocatechuate degradation operon regulator HpaR [Albitalea sp.]|uniref:homoprotocatechuate degradation operon regulator HpaR n=1 Tax=Piscinibacter sp. TaxID=1903157 RepID=UPI002ED36D1B